MNGCVVGSIRGDAIGQVTTISRTNFVLFGEAVQKCCFTESSDFKIAFVGVSYESRLFSHSGASIIFFIKSGYFVFESSKIPAYINPTHTVYILYMRVRYLRLKITSISVHF